MRALFPGRLAEQTLALLVFLLVPYNHSIHHYRDVPVVLASSAVFLLAAAFIRSFAPSAARRRSRSAREDGLRCAQLRADLGGDAARGLEPHRGADVRRRADRARLLAVWRRRALRLAATYAVAAVVVSGSLLLVYRLEGVDPSEASRYQVHTFLDSTPESWLTPACRADPTENCREADGLTVLRPGRSCTPACCRWCVNHPLTTVAKTLRSAWDNLWILLGPEPVDVPGHRAFRGRWRWPSPSACANSHAPACPRRSGWSCWRWWPKRVLPPLSWAPPHPQYHLQLVLPIVVAASCRSWSAWRACRAAGSWRWRFSSATPA